MKSKILPMRSCRHTLCFAILVLSPSCVTETVEDRLSRPLPKILELTTGAIPAGFYHGVQFFFEVEPGDVPDAMAWMLEGTRTRQLPPIFPEIEPGGAEVYRLRDLHEVTFRHNMFETGGYRYPRMPGARLYVFKKRPENFSFSFRGQGIVVPSDVRWAPSIYYYAEEQALDEKKGPGKSLVTLTREVLQVGLATIETLPREGVWLVNGRKYLPDTTRPLELDGAVHAKVAR